MVYIRSGLDFQNILKTDVNVASLPSIFSVTNFISR